MFQTIDGIPYKMKAPFDMSFISNYGRVFKVYDDQDSGNMCFGVEHEGKRYFIKFAGAPTAEYNGTALDAVKRLQRTIPVYEELRHPNLINYLYSESIGEGLTAVFDWVDAICMGRQYPDQREKFQITPDKQRLHIFDEILAFLLHVNEKAYVAIDFYDGSIMFDFMEQKTVICDIDFFQKKPVINEMGRMWGSSRFMSPEEFTYGAPIDEVTNVYLIGAVAFALFGGETDRTFNQWRLSRRLYEVASKAVSDDRHNRFQSIQNLIDEWNKARYSIND